MRFLYFFLIFLISLSCLFAKNNIHGIIIDSQTGKSLPHANIYIENTFIGTVSNNNGYYSLELTTIPCIIVVSHIGYETQKIQIDQVGKIELNIYLKTIIFESKSIVITANREDPAIGIMKKVISIKAKWKNRLKSYKAKAYSRLKVENDTSIVSISESISDIYWDSVKGSAEQFLAKKSTKQMGYLTEMEVGSKNILNLYEDNIKFFNHNFIGPTHPNAMDFYVFELIGIRLKDSTKVYDIKVTPKSILQPLFYGTVSVLEKENAIIELDLSTSKYINYSEMIRDFQANYKQQFSNFGKEFWLLIESRSHQLAEVDMGLLAFPRASFDKISRISDYEINVDVSEKILFIDTVNISDQDLNENIQTFEEFEKIPLTEKEADVFNYPDTTLTLIRSFRPTGLLASYMIGNEKEIEESLSKNSEYNPLSSNTNFDIHGWYNRVEELNLGIILDYKFFDNYKLSLTGGYQTGTNRWYYNTQIQKMFDKNTSLFAGYYNQTDTRYTSDAYSQLFTTILPLFGAPDYFDYFSNKKMNFGLNYEIQALNSEISFEFSRANHSSINKTSNCNILYKNASQRENPKINEGRINSLSVGFVFDESNNIPEFVKKITDMEGYNKIALKIEHSSSKYFKSDFNFTQYKFMVDYTLPTFFTRRPDFNYLRTKFVFSTFTGDLPLQRFVIIDGNIFSYSPFGIFKTRFNRPLEGENKLSLFWEYNLRPIPFEILGISYFTKNKYEIILHGASGRTWINKNRLEDIKSIYDPTYIDGYHHELGLSLKLKYKFIALRLDGTKNFTNHYLYMGFNLSLISLSL